MEATGYDVCHRISTAKVVGGRHENMPAGNTKYHANPPALPYTSSTGLVSPRPVMEPTQKVTELLALGGRHFEWCDGER